MGQGKSTSLGATLSTTFQTKMFRTKMSNSAEKSDFLDVDGSTKSPRSFVDANGNTASEEEKERHSGATAQADRRTSARAGRMSRKTRDKARRASVSLDVRYSMRRQNSMQVHENFVKINTRTNIRDVYTGLDSDKTNVGEGTWGTVKLVRRRSNLSRKAAVKVLKLSTDMKPSRIKELRSEISLLQKIDHPHIAKLYETYEEEGLNLYLVMEYLSGGELFDRVIDQGHFRELKAADAVKQMVGAVGYLHEKGIVHRDLKLENFMYRSKNSDSLVLIDFGLSTRFSPFEDESATKKVYMKEMVGSSYYMAPEVMRRKYGRECDMWSIGVIAYMLLSGHPPFAGDTDDQIMRRVRRGTYNFNHTAFSKVSKSAMDFVEKLLKFEPAERMTAKDALLHPWLSDFHQKQMNRRSQRRASIFDDEVVQNLKNFVHTNRFKKLALQAVAYSTNYEDIAHLQQLFEDIDEDQDGYITMEELQNALRDQPGIDLDFVQKVFSAMDIDKTQKVHLNEFIAATMNKSLMDDEKILREAFRKLDVNETGELDRQTIYELLGGKFSVLQIEAIFKEIADSSGSTEAGKTGKITQTEFINAMRNARLHDTEALFTTPVPIRGSVPDVLDGESLTDEDDLPNI